MSLIKKLTSFVGIGLVTLALNSDKLKAIEGSGTELSPYQITNVDELQEVKNDLGGHYILINNINASGRNFFPIGNNITKFSGNFNGQNHEINNLYINTSISYVGLFGYSTGEVKNLGLENVNITGRNYVGALVGYNEGDITNCNSTGEVKGDNALGGLVGWNKKEIYYSYSKANVEGEGNLIGGFVGKNIDDAIISNCYSTGDVSGYSSIGGFVGKNDNNIEITNCYSTGIVEGTREVGGFCGSLFNSSFGNCFWNKDINPSLPSIGDQYERPGEVDPKTTSQLQTLQTFTEAGWDFNETWDIIEDDDYPFLRQNNQVPPPASQFYAILAGENEGTTHLFGDDAQEIHDALEEYPGINPNNLKLIEPSQLETTINEIIGKIQPTDQLWIYYSGHGYFNNDGTESTIPNSPEVIEQTGKSQNTGDEFLAYGIGMSDDHLTGLLLKINPNVKIGVYLDSCFSGGFWGRPNNEPNNEPDKGDFNLLENIVLFTACKENEFAYSNSSGRGIFSLELEKQLKLNIKGFALADRNEDGAVSSNELKTALSVEYPVRGTIRTDPNAPWFNDPNVPWINDPDPNSIIDPNNIPELYSEHTTDFDPNSALVSKILVGDLNNDKDVDPNDLSLFNKRWMKTCTPPRWCEGADFNFSGKVDMDDLALLTKNWLVGVEQ